MPRRGLTTSSPSGSLPEPDREVSSLSGGESQRVKMVRHRLSLTDITCIFDGRASGSTRTTSAGSLHYALRDSSNTVLVAEHKPQ